MSWECICQPESGGLGIKNLKAFNSSLLCKWKWRCLEDGEAPWFDFLLFRYGSFTANFLLEEGSVGLKKASIWWRYIWRLGSSAEGGWFGRNIASILGNGNAISFWKEKWCGTSSLRDLYPSLFLKTHDPVGNVSAMGSWVSNSWSWKLEWRSVLTVEEAALAIDLLAVLDQVRSTREV
jgi:hypothetical protein